MDRCFIAQPPISTNHFAGGISIISQVTRQEHCAFQQAILSIIIGHDHIDNKVINAISSLLDFSYLAQYPSLSASEIHKMEEALTTFHGNKQVFVDNGLRDPPHFQIPKLHRLQHFIGDITTGGTPNNSSTETPESLHIEMCKEPYLASNHCEYDKQILNYLDVQDRLAMRYAYESHRESEKSHVSTLEHNKLSVHGTESAIRNPERVALPFTTESCKTLRIDSWVQHCSRSPLLGLRH
jgi:hypothetical protein